MHRARRWKYGERRVRGDGRVRHDRAVDDQRQFRWSHARGRDHVRARDFKLRHLWRFVHRTHSHGRFNGDDVMLGFRYFRLDVVFASEKDSQDRRRRFAARHRRHSGDKLGGRRVRWRRLVRARFRLEIFSAHRRRALANEFLRDAVRVVRTALFRFGAKLRGQARSARRGTRSSGARLRP